MLPATQLQKDTPPETTCDAYTSLVISHDITSRPSFVARRTVWAGAANTQHSRGLHCVVSTSRARSQMMQGKTDVMLTPGGRHFGFRYSLPKSD